MRLRLLVIAWHVVVAGAWVAFVALKYAEVRAARVDTLTTKNTCELKVRPPEGKVQTVTYEATWTPQGARCKVVRDEITEAK